MLLAVDIGNTNIVFGVHDTQTWRHRWRVRTVRDKMPDEYGVTFRVLFQDAGLSIDALDRIVICSVVPPLTDRIAAMLTDFASVDPLIVSHTVCTGLTFAVDNPAEIGADLIADAVAAYDRVHGPCIVVDFGTATTFTAISAQAAFLGVAIAPGMNLAASALAGGTAQLPQIRLAPPPAAVGTNTVHAIQSGVVLGHAALVEGMLRRIALQMAVEPTVIATGGLSPLMAPLTGAFAFVDPWLTLEGIRLIAELNP